MYVRIVFFSELKWWTSLIYLIWGRTVSLPRSVVLPKICRRSRRIRGCTASDRWWLWPEGSRLISCLAYIYIIYTVKITIVFWKCIIRYLLNISFIRDFILSRSVIWKFDESSSWDPSSGFPTLTGVFNGENKRIITRTALV